MHFSGQNIIGAIGNNVKDPSQQGKSPLHYLSEKTLAFLLWPGLQYQRPRHMWVEFNVIGSLPFSERRIFLQVLPTGFLSS